MFDIPLSPSFARDRRYNNDVEIVYTNNNRITIQRKKLLMTNNQGSIVL